MTKNDTDEKNLAPLQAKVIAALLTMPNVSSAADEAKVPLSTVRRWMSSDETFKRALQDAEREAIGDVSRRLAGTGSAAVVVVRHIMADTNLPASVRLRAAQLVLDQMLRLRELTTLEERIAALEAQSTLTK